MEEAGDTRAEGKSGFSIRIEILGPAAAGPTTGLSPNTENSRLGTLKRLSLIVGLAVLHFGSYVLVNQLYLLNETVKFWNFQTTLDSAIPYWPWTWVFYYFGFIYSGPWAALVVWRLPARPFRMAIGAALAMTLAGAAIHLLIPSRAPWPETLGSVQKAFKESLSVKPLACFPSMHVATALFPAFVSLHVFRSRAVRVASVTLAVLIAISTVTAKEHYVLDVLGGAILASVIFYVWRRKVAVGALDKGGQSETPKGTHYGT